jgi:hypothetical protein
MLSRVNSKKKADENFAAAMGKERIKTAPAALANRIMQRKNRLLFISRLWNKSARQSLLVCLWFHGLLSKHSLQKSSDTQMHLLRCFVNTATALYMDQVYFHLPPRLWAIALYFLRRGQKTQRCVFHGFFGIRFVWLTSSVFF